MPLIRPSLAELVTRAVADVSSRTQGSAFIKRSVERVLAMVNAALANGVYGYFEWVKRQALPTTAELDGLLGWGAWLQVLRKGAVKASGLAQFEGTIGVNVPAFTQLQTVDGILYETTSTSVTTDAGLWVPSVRAVVAGSAGNLEAGAPLALVSPVSGIAAAGVVYAGGITGGEDIEDVEDYRPRVIDALRTPPAGGGTGDYVSWAREVPGVTRAWEFGGQQGFGTVTVGFVMDGRDEIIPTDLDIANVQAHIDAVRPIDMRALYVRAPNKIPVNITLSVNPNNAVVRAAVSEELRLLFIREPSMGVAMARSKLDEAISTAPGEEDHTITVLSSLDPGAAGLLVLGTVTYV